MSESGRASVVSEDEGRTLHASQGEVVLPLSPGVVATVCSVDEGNSVFLSIDDEAGTSFNIRIPSEQASDLAVALVNSANGL